MSRMWKFWSFEKDKKKRKTDYIKNIFIVDKVSEHYEQNIRSLARSDIERYCLMLIPEPWCDYTIRKVLFL
ncbi:hypothetical protein ALC53_01760 [Atta colombica]|uniref:Uncharacterized protein n=1 Tax=Atta colombica TaxID=520822 RepID=A0A151I659_9HYME|nr:hypothetical protein ALC53_01760 [Atta colombica]